MSTVQKINFEPVSDILPTTRRDFTLADTTLLDPTSATPLVDGEWATIDSSYKLVRASTVGTPGNANTSALARPYWMEKGRTDAQAMKKGVVLWMGEWEADTRIFDASAVVGSGAAITAVAQPVKVATITIGSRNYTGLVGHGGSGDAHPIVGYVTRLPASNGGKLRIMSGSRR